MKKIMFISLAPIIASVVMGCQRECCDSRDVVMETYVHKYGVEVPANDWTSRGQSGQVISTLSSGVKVARNYQNGMLEGETTYSFPHSETIEKIETYEQDTLVKEVFHNLGGTAVKEIQYRSPTHKLIAKWYDNGSPQSEEEMEGDTLLNGSYFTLNHKLESRVDNEQGIRTQRDSDGQLLTSDTIEDGEMTLQVSYYPNLVPQAKTPYRYGLIEGQRQVFLRSGAPDKLEEWVAGKQEGITIEFRNGEKFAEVPYVKGVKEGIEKRYRDGSIVVEEITWNQGQKHGPAVSFVQGITNTDWYLKDRLVTKATYDQLTKPMR